MKLAILLSLITATTAQQLRTPDLVCEVINDPHPQKEGGATDTGKDCNDLRQLNEGTCAADEVKLVDVKMKFTICDANINGGQGINGNKSEVWFRGRAYKNAAESISGTTLPAGPVIIKWKDMDKDDTSVPPANCKERFLSFKVDKCASHWNAEFFAKANGASAEPSESFDTYMRRNCPLYTEINCKTPSGIDCDDMTECESGVFEYEFCYYTTFTEHRIRIRRDWLDDNRCLTGTYCQESHAFIGGYVDGNQVYKVPGDSVPVPDFLWLPGADGLTRVCSTKKVTIPAASSACVKTDLPKAYINIVGSVKDNDTGAVNYGEYKACFSNTRMNYDGEEDEGDDDCDEKSKSPAYSKGKGTKSPGTSKGTKSPGTSKGTKSPGSSKGTKSPGYSKGTKCKKSKAPGSSKGTKSPGSSKGTKSPAASKGTAAPM